MKDCLVRVTRGCTINTGNYNSERLELAVEVPVQPKRGETEDELWARVEARVDDLFQYVSDRMNKQARREKILEANN